MNRKLLNTLKADVQDVLKTQPGLRLKFKGEVPCQIWGTYEVFDDKQVVQGTFDIQVTIPVDYPNGFPTLKETSKKIERNDERHIGKDGSVCEEIDPMESIIASKGISIKEYFERYVHKHFCWQLIYEEEGNKNLGEWSHHGDGILQFYKERLKLAEAELVETCLTSLIQNKMPGRNDPCLCRSEKKFKHCHYETFNELQRISRARLIQDLLAIRQMDRKPAINNSSDKD